MGFGVRQLARTWARKSVTAGLLAASTFGVSACQSLVVGALTVGDMSNIAGTVSTLSTGKGLPEHFLSFLTGQDCRISEGLTRTDRHVCAMPGSPETDKDFKGVIVWMMDEEAETDAPAQATGPTRVLYAGNLEGAGYPSSANGASENETPLVAETLATPSMTRVLRRGPVEQDPTPEPPEGSNLADAESSDQEIKSVSLFPTAVQMDPLAALLLRGEEVKTKVVFKPGPADTTELAGPKGIIQPNAAAAALALSDQE